MLDRIYAQLRDTPSQIEIRREQFRCAWNLEALRSLEELVSVDERRQLYAQVHTERGRVAREAPRGATNI
jgi:hypothetical protein